MAIVEDPEGNETFTLHSMVDLTDRGVLEIGCGEGRLTWRYADEAAHVTAIDPIAEDIERARANLPNQLKGRVTFVETSIEDFAESNRESRFDIAIFAWSL
jgi:2-polyprenyl-3-methyl-5-hydroxy-6-metoxy-1,4-benzoquinol methylase